VQNSNKNHIPRNFDVGRWYSDISDTEDVTNDYSFDAQNSSSSGNAPGNAPGVNTENAA
jgi:hypothetical protein